MPADWSIIVVVVGNRILLRAFLVPRVGPEERDKRVGRGSLAQTEESL